MAEKIVYKIFTATEFDHFRRDGVFAGSPADKADGFIHLSSAAQLDGTLSRHYPGQTGLVLAAIDNSALGAALRWEVSRGGALFPHLYGTLPLAALTWAGPVERASDGVLLLPR